MLSMDNCNDSMPPSGYTLAPGSIGVRIRPLNCGLGSYTSKLPLHHRALKG